MTSMAITTTLSASLLAGVLALPAVALAQNSAQKVLFGDAKVTVIQRYSGTDKLPRPSQTIVYDFNVPANVITIDNSRAAHILSHDPIARIKGDTGREQDPAAVAAKVQTAFSQQLVHELAKTSVPAVAASSSAPSATTAGVILVRGDFTAVDQGNKAVRMMIGFGRGASDVQAHVVVSLLTQSNPIVLAEFNLDSQSGKKPGAAATMGVGSAAASAGASGAADTKATVEGDTSRMAKAVAKQIEDIMVEQQWIAPAANPK